MQEILHAAETMAKPETVNDQAASDKRKVIKGIGQRAPDAVKKTQDGRVHQ